MILKITTYKVRMWEKENKKSVAELLEPDLENLVELVKLGRGCDDNVAYEEIDTEFEGGKELLDIFEEIAPIIGKFTPLGRKGAIDTFKLIREEVAKKLAMDISEVEVDNTEDEVVTDNKEL